MKADVSAEEADKVMDFAKKDWPQLLAEWRREFRSSRKVRKEKIESAPGGMGRRQAVCGLGIRKRPYLMTQHNARV